VTGDVHVGDYKDNCLLGRDAVLSGRCFLKVGPDGVLT